MDGRVLFVMHQFASIFESSIGHNIHSVIPPFASQQLYALQLSCDVIPCIKEDSSSNDGVMLQWGEMILKATVEHVPLTCRLQRCLDSFTGNCRYIANTSSHVLSDETVLHERDNGRRMMGINSKSSLIKSDRELMMEYPQLVSTRNPRCVLEKRPSIDTNSLAEYAFMADWAV